jgi:predicted DNA-binding protein (MmcQ/YjbR family)
MFSPPAMNIEQIREYCLSLKGVTEDMPFGNDTLVFRVMNKIFALTNLEGEIWINLKCDPAKAIELREEHSAIIPGYHMNKQHWNTVTMNGSLKKDLVTSLIDHSYELVAESLPKAKKEELKRI